MPSASWALQQAIFATLTADAPLLALLGAPRLYDDVPQAADFPYLTFGQSLDRDWSTGTEPGNEHTLTLHVWSQARGKKETHEIIDALRTALHDQPLSLTGHRLVNLRVTELSAARDKDSQLTRVTLRLRAVTEVV